MTTSANVQLSIHPAADRGLPRRSIQTILPLVMSIVALALQTTPSKAQTSVTPNVTVGNLSGTWVISLAGVTGCGQVTLRDLATLNSSGNASSTSLITHSSECGDGTNTEGFTINSLNSAGTGTAHLSCGANCGWDFDIQVASGNNVFSLVDVTNGQNYLAGTAVRKQ